MITINIVIITSVVITVVIAIAVVTIVIVMCKGIGMQSWGGGSVCQEYAGGEPPVQILCRTQDATGAFTVNGTCFAPAQTALCTGNGEVELKFGSPEYVGLGALVFLLLVLLETFGSPFMRNCEVSRRDS